MKTFDEARRVLEQLSGGDRLEIMWWLQEFNHNLTAGYHVAEARLAYGEPDPPSMTLEEFLEFEKKSPERHEYIDGIVFAMAGVTLAHDRVKNNLFAAFRGHLGRGPCEVFSSDVMLVIRRDMSEIMYHPDIMIDCRPDTRELDALQSPKLIVEVQSPSTELIDRREKLSNYRRITSIEEYVMAAQDEHKLTIHRRVGEKWRKLVFAGPEAIAEF